jgi:WD40 repeat protein
MIGLEFAPDNRTLLSSAGGARLHLWDSQTGRELFVNSGHDDMIRSLAFTLDGKQVISMADKTIRLWDAATGRQVRMVGQSPRWGTGLSLTRDGRAVLSGGYTCVRLNELATGRELQSFLSTNIPKSCLGPSPSCPGTAPIMSVWRRMDERQSP